MHGAGEVRKVSRYGGSAAPTVYTRVRTPASEVCIVDETLAPRSASINEAKPKPREVRHFAAVSCMTVRAAPVGLPPAPTTTAGRYGAEERAESNEGGGWGYSSRAAMLPRAPLILVGRVDGTVDLFHMDDAAPVQTWDLTAFTPNRYAAPRAVQQIWLLVDSSVFGYPHLSVVNALGVHVLFRPSYQYIRMIFSH